MPIAIVAAAIYRGRFAPSPSGPLHLGSLCTALASYLDARAACGTWFLRIEDLDPPREEPGATTRIIASLRAHALHWDEAILYQSRRLDIYEAAAARLLTAGLAFHCTCSRRDRELHAGHHASTCPRSMAPPPGASSVRLHAAATRYGFDDLILGRVELARPAGDDDFVIRRRDGLHAYQLAVVIDDAAQDITHVVRGADLLDSTPHQILLHELLGREAPHYAHVPLLLDEAGEKLSKQNHAPPLDDTRAASNLLACLEALGQTLPPADLRHDCTVMLRWGIDHWSRAKVPHRNIRLRR